MHFYYSDRYDNHALSYMFEMTLSLEKSVSCVQYYSEVKILFHFH